MTQLITPNISSSHSRQTGWLHRRLLPGVMLTRLAMVITPLAWPFLTMTDVNNVNLPGAYASVDEFAAPDRNNNRRGE